MKTIKEIREMSDIELRDLAFLTEKQIIKNEIIKSFQNIKDFESALSLAQTIVNSHENNNWDLFKKETKESFKNNKELALIVIKERKGK